MEKPKILITGGAGYIGSYINKLSADSGYETIVLDDLSSGSKDLVIRGELVVGDVGDESCLDRIFSTGIDAVIHMAALISVGESVADPIRYYQTNTCKSLTLIKKMVEHRVKHLVFSSTAAVYGMPKDGLVTEEAPLSPINPYGKSKMMVEEILRDLNTLKSISLRYFNVAGGDPSGELATPNLVRSNLIPTLMHAYNDFTINGDDYDTPDGTCVRDYIHIHDLATAHLLALQKLLDGCDSTVYNLGSETGNSVLEVVSAFERATGITVNKRIGPRRPGDPALLVASAKRAERELGWKPHYPELETIIGDAWKCAQPRR